MLDMKTYNQPITQILHVENYLCQNATSPVDPKVYSPLSNGGAGSGQSGAM